LRHGGNHRSYEENSLINLQLVRKDH
jgi:hypothetical protein